MSDTIDPIIAYDFNFISTTVLTAIGLVGNSLVVFILSRPEFLKVPMFRYLIAATIFDTINVLLSWPSVYPDAFQVNNLPISCKLYIYLFYIPFQASPWIIALSSVDRYLSIKYPKSLNFRNQFKYQLLAIIIILIGILLIDIPFYIYHDVLSNETGCVPTEYKIEFYLDVLDALISTIIPFIIMILSTILTSCLIVSQKAKLQKDNSKKFQKEMQLIKVLLAMDIYFLICNLPYCILTIVDDVLAINYFGTFSFYILNALTYVFSSCDFIIYFSFNKLFRKHFLSMISYFRKDKFNSSKIATSTANNTNNTNLKIRQ